jgi:Flp pilus assembly pilin Flp
VRRPAGDDGASSVEYALVVTAIAGVLVVVLFLLGGAVTRLFGTTCESVADKADPTATC